MKKLNLIIILIILPATFLFSQVSNSVSVGGNTNNTNSNKGTSNTVSIGGNTNNTNGNEGTSNSISIGGNTNTSKTISTSNLLEKVSSYVNDSISAWQQQGMFEKTSDYTKRTSYYEREKKINLLTQQKLQDELLPVLNSEILSTETSEYDPDSELFRLNFKNFPSIYLPVPIADAQQFYANISKAQFVKTNFSLIGENESAITSAEVFMPELGKTYKYDAKKEIVFKSVAVSKNKANVDIKITNYNNIAKVENIKKDNLLENLPQNPVKPNRYALIIGNETYKSLIPVDYALNDSRTFKIYAEKILGIPADNIKYLENVGVTDFKSALDKTSNLMNSNRELYVFYAGHGYPTKDGEAYLMPVDVNEDNVTEYGIKLFDFYQKLSENNPAKVTVFIDACFSGGGRNGLSVARSGIKLKPKETDLGSKIVSFTASTGDEISQKYEAQQHGLFTYYVLKILKETNGNINYDEFSKKLQTEVKDRSNKIDGLKEQNPKVSIGSGAINWENWKINE